MRARLLALCVPLLAIACARPPAAPEDPVILSLDGQEVRRSEFSRHLASVQARGGGLALDDAVRQAVLQSFLEQRVLVIAARSRGYAQPGDSAESEELAVNRLLGSEVPPVAVSDEDVAAYHASHKAEFHAGERATLRQVLLGNEMEAREVREKLVKNPKDFEALARSRSKGPEAARGGLMGEFARGELPPELEAPAFTLPLNEVSQVVASPLGYHVLRVEARQAARDGSLPDVQERIRERLRRERSQDGVRRYVSGLLARARVDHEAASVAVAVPAS